MNGLLFIGFILGCSCSVARCLAEVCGKSDTESFQIMMHAHQQGMGIIGQYDLEIAELYLQSLQERGLLVDMIPVEDE